MTRHQTIGMRIGLALLLAGGGCGGGLPSSVEGRVTLAGRPLADGTVAFHPSGGGPTSYGRIQADGRYSISTGGRAGLTAGEYAVCVVATGRPADSARDEPGPLLTPVRYGDLKTTDLRATVEAGANTVDLELHAE